MQTLLPEKRGLAVSELHDRIKTESSGDIWDSDRDWVMLAICALLLVGWASWLGIIAYRLLVP